MLLIMMMCKSKIKMSKLEASNMTNEKKIIKLSNKSIIKITKIIKNITKISDPYMFIIKYFTNLSNLSEFVKIPIHQLKTSVKLIKGDIKGITKDKINDMIILLITFYRVIVYDSIIKELKDITNEWINILPESEVSKLLSEIIDDYKPKNIKNRLMNVNENANVKDIINEFKFIVEEIKNKLIVIRTLIINLE